MHYLWLINMPEMHPLWTLCAFHFSTGRIFFLFIYFMLFSYFVLPHTLPQREREWNNKWKIYLVVVCVCVSVCDVALGNDCTSLRHSDKCQLLYMYIICTYTQQCAVCSICISYLLFIRHQFAYPHKHSRLYPWWNRFCIRNGTNRVHWRTLDCYRTQIYRWRIHQYLEIAV